MSDDDIFRISLGDVKPLKVNPKVNLQSAHQSAQTLANRRAAAVTEAECEDPLAGDHIPPVDPLDELNYQRPGVQHGVHKKLRLGKYPIDARLDLHNQTLEQARRQVYQFIRDCMIHDIRCGLITHGKGEGREQPAVLKSAVAHWLKEMPEVLAYHSALKRHGGLGSVYVLLKKSDRKRMENKERF